MADKKPNWLARKAAKFVEKRGYAVTPKNSLPQAPVLHPELADSFGALASDLEAKKQSAQEALSRRDNARADLADASSTLSILESNRDAAREALLASEVYQNLLAAQGAVESQQSNVNNLKQAAETFEADAKEVLASFNGRVRQPEAVEEVK